MFYRYDEVSIMAKAHMADLKYDQECCLRARKIRKAKRTARNAMATVLSVLAPEGYRR